MIYCLQIYCINSLLSFSIKVVIKKIYIVTAAIAAISPPYEELEGKGAAQI